MEAEIFQQHDIAGFHFGDEAFNSGADAVRSKNHFFAEQALEAFRNGSQAEFRIEFSLWPPEVRAQNDFGALVDGAIDGGQCRSNPSVIGNLQGIIERDVVVGANDDPLPAKLNILNDPFANIHGRVPTPYSQCAAQADGSADLSSTRQKQRLVYEVDSRPVGDDVFDQVPYAAGIAPLIVVPGGDFDKPFVDDGGQRGIDNRGVRIILSDRSRRWALPNRPEYFSWGLRKLF